MTKDTLLIIPAYNEEQSIGKVLDELYDKKIHEKMDILVINDGSKDKTVEVVKNYPDIKFLSQIFNMGYGAALQTGYKYAHEHGYQYLLQMDADGQHDLVNLSIMYDRLTGNIPAFGNARKNEDGTDLLPDIIIGSRFLEGGQSFRISGLKKLAIGMFNFVIKRQTGYKLTDPTSGLQALNKNAFTCYSQFDQFDIEYPDINMILQMLYKGFHIEETPAIMHERSAGVSMHTGLIHSGIYMLIMMIAVMRISLQFPKKQRLIKE